jgi:hypothetical protein
MLRTNIFKKVAGLAFAMLLLLTTHQVKAQRDNSGPNFGIKGGLNFSQLYVDQPNAEDEHMKLGYHFGLFGTIPISSLLLIQHEGIIQGIIGIIGKVGRHQDGFHDLRN